VPGSALLVAGLVVVVAAAVLLWTVARLRSDVASARRLLRRVDVAAAEVERVDRAWRHVGDGLSRARGGAIGVNRVVRRSGQAVAGIPYAILDGIARIRRRDDATP
jgi:hypothetical protein